MNNIEFYDNFTVIDIETTGLNAAVDKIIELSAIKVRENQLLKHFQNSLIRKRK